MTLELGQRVEIVDRRGVVEEGEVVSVSPGGIGVLTVSGTWAVPASGVSSKSGRSLRVLTPEEVEARAAATRARAAAVEALGALGLHLPGRASGWGVEKLRHVEAAAYELREALS